MKNPKPTGSLKGTYTESFFRQHDNSFYNALAKAILHTCDHVKSSLDLGCGHGFLVEALRNAGVKSYGLEGSESAEAMWPEAFREFYTIKDLTHPECKLQITKTDLVCSFEVAEHIPANHATAFVNMLTLHKPKHVVFGAATSYQDLNKNPTHVNEQPFSYWIDRFTRTGYELELLKTIHLKELLFEGKRSEGIRWWYPKNAMVFVPEGSISNREKYDLELIKVNSDDLRWRIRSKNPVFNVMAERDYYEYLYIVESAISAAKSRLGGNVKNNTLA